MPPGKRKAAASSAADGAAPAAGQREERERGFDAKAVKDFLAKIQRPDRLGPNFFTDDERQQWQDYFDQQPLTAEAASDAATLLPVQMPRKCLPRTAAAGSSGADLARSNTRWVPDRRSRDSRYLPLRLHFKVGMIPPINVT